MREYNLTNSFDVIFFYSTANLIFFGFLIILLILPIFDRHKIGKFQTQKSLLGIRLWAITYLLIERARCLPQINVIKFEDWDRECSRSIGLKSFCLRDRGRLGNRGRPIWLKFGTLSCYGDLCNMPRFQLYCSYLGWVLDGTLFGVPQCFFYSPLITMSGIF